jgi:hypothetical protein
LPASKESEWRLLQQEESFLNLWLQPGAGLLIKAAFLTFASCFLAGFFRVCQKNSFFDLPHCLVTIRGQVYKQRAAG